MKLTDKVPYVCGDGQVIHVDRAVVVNSVMTELMVMRIVDQQEHERIVKRLLGQYNAEIAEVAKPR